MNIEKLIEQIKNFFRLILYMDYSFNYPKKNKILLFDHNLGHFLLKYISRNKYTILHSRNKNYNFIILIKTLFNNIFRRNNLNYFDNFIKYVDPKVIITFSDNYSIFYKLKVPKGARKIFIQAAYRTAVRDDIFYYTNLLKSEKKLNSVDYMLVFNNKVGIEYQKFIKGKYKDIGSFKSNFFKISKNKKKYDIFFVSVWRNNAPDWHQTKTVTMANINSRQKELLEYLKDYAKKNKRHITVYGKYDYPKEKEFFSKILNGCDWKFLNNDRMKTYKYCDEAELIVSTNSTLGYEALARGSKVAIFNILNFDRSTQSRNFCWPHKIQKNGPFWTSTLSQKSCYELIDNLSNIKKKKWVKIVNKNMKKVLTYDDGNKKFTSLIKKLIN
jgi:surface carbohydrate biosynthesis protein